MADSLLAGVVGGDNEGDGGDVDEDDDGGAGNPANKNYTNNTTTEHI